MLLVIVTGNEASAAEKALPDLITIGAPAKRAELVAIEPGGDLQFRDAAGNTTSVKVSDLVRWSTPLASRGADELLLADGGRLGLAAAWGKEPVISFDGSKGVARTTQFGRIEFDRSRARAILWQLPRDDARRQREIDDFRASSSKQGASDFLALDNGDLLSGTLIQIGQLQSPSDADGTPLSVTFDGSLGQVELPIGRIRGIHLADQPDAHASAAMQTAPLQVGLRDGSLIKANSFKSDDGQLIVTSPILGELRLDRLEDVVSLQAVGNRISNLSDIEPVSYRHEPYLELAWPFRRDRSVLGAPLRVGDRKYLKGLGIHSASRLTFELAGPHDRFAAAVALDDAAEGRGSVVFRVFLSARGAWREVYASSVVRGGDPPQEVTVDLAGAKQLALVVDYADRGDERDYANWLDARLEHTAE